MDWNHYSKPLYKTPKVLFPRLGDDILNLWRTIKEDYPLPEVNKTTIYKIKGLGRLEVYNNRNETLTVCFFKAHSHYPNQFDIFHI